ncbi:hypothetical protein R1flu_025413 [Riccia fluitans]|uniref:Malic enzyme n=1 Tax=Riccia fluitans TaxID=41844 RepID=A0ABD1Y0Q7_9MARC
MATTGVRQRRHALMGESRFTMMTIIAENAAMETVRGIEKELDKYLYMRQLHHENPNLYYKLLINNAQELLPVVYAPTVGQVYMDYSKLPIHIYGLVIRPEHRGKIFKRLKEWSGHHRVRVVVVTDGERVLGLGDLGFNGMAIAEGKILLYTVMAGVNPAVCMPCCLDVGTNNETLLADPTYQGLRQKRLEGPEYDDLVDEFMNAVKALHDHTLLQFEDFGNHNAFRLLEKYAPLQCSFNDDIQGTACITLAGVFSALRITGKSIQDQRVVVLGAGEAGTGVGQLICRAIRAETGMTVEESLQRCFYLDSKGLICKSRTDLQHHKLPFAHDIPHMSSLLEAVTQLKPTILVGACTQGGAFTKEIVEITDDVFLQAAKILAGMTPEELLEDAQLFPTIADMKDLVVHLISGLAEFMVASGLGRQPAGVTNWPDYIKSKMYQPGVTPALVVEKHHVVTRELYILRQTYTPIQRYLFLRHLLDSQPDIFWNLMINNAEELLPDVYTPTVGDVCLNYCSLPIKTRGLYIKEQNSGRILEKLENWRHQDIRVVVVTDGERILGLGDLGAGGMGISEGKIILYTVFGGLNPEHCIPICIDVGTNKESFLQDPQYYGVRHKRLRGEKYDALIHELVHALKKWRPHVLLQFEDFGNTNAFRLLDKYRNEVCCFNDDIQATACISLAGILNSLRITGKKLEEQRILVFGAGEAGTGIGKIVALAVVQQCGLTQEEALKFCYLVDSHGLVCKSRSQLAPHKLPFAHDIVHQPDLLSSVRSVRPTVLIGASAVAGAFSKEVLEVMQECNERPVIFPLSNPTSMSECTFEDAYKYTGGTAVFASGSPFPSYVTLEGKTLYPSQVNNAYISIHILRPFILSDILSLNSYRIISAEDWYRMAAVLTKCKMISDELFLTTAELIAGAVSEARLESGMLVPTFSDMKEVAPHLIAGICEFIVKTGQGTKPPDVMDWLDYVKEQMYKPPDNDVPAFPSP